jgi:hypothetical protein
MKLFIAGIFLVFFSLSGYSQARFFNFALSYHPKRVFAADTTVIVLINRFDLAKFKISKELVAWRKSAYAAIDGAAKNLYGLGRVKVINLADSATMAVDTSSTRFLTSRYHADYVLTLDNFSAWVYLMTGENNSNNYMLARATLSFTIFDRSNKSLKKLPGSGDATQGSNFIGIIPSLLSKPTLHGNQELVDIAAANAAGNALQEYLPHTVTHQRVLYDQKELDPAVRLILTGHYDEACNLLKPLLESENVKLASKAAYDLAVVYEAQGNVDGAMDMARQSLAIRKPWNTAGLLIDSLKNE